jgi:sulfur-oxidizing protein SoxZ
MAAARTLITVPASARRGAVIEIRTLISHPMETGYRRGADGNILARDLIRRFSCRYDGELVFAAELHAAIAANPYLAFHTRATASGVLTFSWEGDNGYTHTESRSIVVT